ncbi:MAG: hypothetical protein ACI97A_000649 [Planctomycetota bacterium]|jgi:hypothetical protein
MKTPTILFLMILTLPVFGQDDTKQETPVNGMTISCPGSGRLWGSDAMVETMKNLKAIGVNWITIHPYAGIRNNGLVASRVGDGSVAPQWITRPIKEAHKLGLKVLMKPHIAYWGSKFSWRGEIAFEAKDEQERFFSSYEKWIVAMAKISKEADAFVIGTELDKLVHHKAEWQKMIKSVRTMFKGPLTYAANWSDFERVPFWQELDVVGIQAYFPIIEGPHAGNKTPTREMVRGGWQKISKRMNAYSKATGKKICFTELGYNRSSVAPYKPWDYATGGEGAESIQTICMEEALKAIAKEPAIVGSFLWKYFPGRRQPRNFNMHTKAMRDTIKAQWKETKKS